MLMIHTGSDEAVDNNSYNSSCSHNTNHLAPRNKAVVGGRYLLESSPLAESVHGDVRVCVDVTTQQTLCAKRTQGRQHITQARREAAILNKLRGASANVLQLKDYVESADEAILVTELCRGGELFDLVQQTHGKGLLENDALDLFREAAYGLQTVHKAGLAHMDVSPENFLLTDGAHSKTNSRGGDDEQGARLKLIDFGLTVVAAGADVSQPRGKMAYMAPEIAKPALQQQDASNYDPRCADVYGLGVMLAVMLLGFQPYELPSCSRDQRFDVLMRHGFKKLLGCYGKKDHISADVASLLEQMLTLDHRRRLTIDQVLDHPVLNKMIG